MRGPAAAHIGILLLTFAASPLLAATNLINLQSKTHGPISFSMDASSDAVHLDKGLLLTLSYRAPEHIQITPPDLGTRFTGFTIDTQFQAEPDRTGTTVLYKTKLRLLPEISHEYRIAPFSVEYRDIQDPSAKTHWFATKPVTLSVVSPLPPGQPNDLGSVTAPVWIAPDTATILIYLGYATAGLLIAWTLFRVIRTLRNRVKEAKRNPREVALGRLDALLARKLIETGDVKTFYFELTSIVRHYIEHAHEVRAPEQTTEEFLHAVSKDSRFTPEVITRLKGFLRSADMVKYAAQTPNNDMIAESVTSAREYIRNDKTDLNEAPSHA